MKTKMLTLLIAGSIMTMTFISCNSEKISEENQAVVTEEGSATEDGGQSMVQDDVSQRNIVQVAVGSPDHTTLVTAVKAASLVDVLSNAGPFTVFAPTNEAFAKLPAGTVDDLLKPENKQKLQGILEYHVYVGSVKTDYMQDGQKLDQVNSAKVILGVKDGKYTVNGANIIATIQTSNGIIHVIDAVLLPPAQ